MAIQRSINLTNGPNLAGITSNTLTIADTGSASNRNLFRHRQQFTGRNRKQQHHVEFDLRNGARDRAHRPVFADQLE